MMRCAVGNQKNFFIILIFFYQSAIKIYCHNAAKIPLEKFSCNLKFKTLEIMRLGQNPLFRKAIVPWYDSETACLIAIVLLVVVLLFGLVGISVARENVEYHEYMWVAVLLAVLSGAVIVSTAIRLVKRYTHRFTKS